MDKAFKWMAVFTTVIMFILMIAGALVTNTGSGMGCGNDWPLCHGKFIPEYTVETMIEYTHRLITGFAGVVVIVFSVWAWLRYRGNREVKILSFIGILFIVIESLLGAAAVMWPQSPSALALHFGFSLMAFTSVFLLSIFVLQRDKAKELVKQPVSKGFKVFAWITVIYTYADIYLGAYVRHSGASLACTDFPKCYPDTFIPNLTGLAGVHFAHRVAAVILFFLIIGLLVYSVRHFKETRRDIYVASLIALLLVLAQIASGISVVLTRLNIFSTLAHAGFITLLFGMLSYICLQTLKRPEKM
ncbi:COX15/CtaA family protein [Fictibacillus gelatini]|uniref:COX15/CtaA family protein n=1 Tax=Fictibacillus gelatini TaxID=225985 RepID=UPI00041F4302|nr:heme A synthase [Fictibacillus gelatini]